MNCGALELWLDEGMPDRGSTASRAHAARCPLCGPRLRAAEQLEALLAAVPPGAPAGFEDRVLARIAALPAPAAASSRAPAPTPATPRRLPWWSWIGAEPALPLALAVGSTLLGLTRAALVLGGLRIRLPFPALAPGVLRAALDGSPLRATGVALALLPPVLLLSYVLYRSTQGLVRRSLFRQ